MSDPRQANFFTKATVVFYNVKYIYAVYILLAIAAALKQNLNGSYNNYLIFKYVFWHTIDLKPLYTLSKDYMDMNHYGPFFSVLIAPFAIFPDWAGTFLWNIANTVVLIWGIHSLTLTNKTKAIIAWICAHELLTSLFSFQFNVASTGLILLSFAWLEKRKEFLAASAIVVGLFVKLYGIVGLAFFFFIKRKAQFILWLIVWSIVCLVLPMFLSNSAYIFNAYTDWFHSIVDKNTDNKANLFADISLFGFMSRALHININSLMGVLAGGIVLLIALARTAQHQFAAYRYMILCYLLLCLVLLNTNVESPTYIIGFMGVAIWYMIVPRSGYTIALLVFAVVLTSFSPSDLFPKFVRENYVRPYALKALPCILIWFDVIYRVLLADFTTYTTNIFLEPQEVEAHVG